MSLLNEYEGKVKDMSGNNVYIHDVVVFARNNMYMELDDGSVVDIEKPNENGVALVHIKSNWSGRVSKRSSQHIYVKPSEGGINGT